MIQESKKDDLIQQKLQQALTLHQQGQLAEAELLYREVLSVEPKQYEALHLLGVVAYQTKNYLKAIDLISKAIALSPNNTLFYYNLGNAFQDAGNLNEALANYDKTIALKPDYAEAHFNRGNTYQKLGQLGNALTDYNTALKLNPNQASAYYNLGRILQEFGRFEAALISYTRAAELKPDYAEAYFNQGFLYQENKKLEQALTSYNKAIEARPLYAEAYSNRGNVLQSLNRLDEAVKSYDQAVAIKPNYAEAYSNRGLVLQELKELDAAVVSYDKAIESDSHYALAYLNKAFLLLLRGDFDKGWKLYEWRWKSSDATPRHFAQPLWLGKESLAGKTILLHWEQGLGDTIQFCRYAQQVADLGARVLLEVQPSLVTLFKNLPGVSELVSFGSELPSFDYYCSLMSLPLALKTSLQTIPSPAHYLVADKDKILQWNERLGKKTAPRIGLVWGGSAAKKNDHKRSILLADLIQKLPRNFQYVSLQKEVRDADKLTLLSNPHIKDFSDHIHDFSDTAALCEQMDLVISVDTSVAHLNGALGKPTWILLPFSPDWRWLLDRADSPWYCGAKLYRQEKLGDWEGVYERLKKDLISLQFK